LEEVQTQDVPVLLKNYKLNVYLGTSNDHWDDNHINYFDLKPDWIFAFRTRQGNGISSLELSRQLEQPFEEVEELNEKVGILGTIMASGLSSVYGQPFTEAGENLLIFGPKARTIYECQRLHGGKIATLADDRLDDFAAQVGRRPSIEEIVKIQDFKNTPPPLNRNGRGEEYPAVDDIAALKKYFGVTSEEAEYSVAALGPQESMLAACMYHDLIKNSKIDIVENGKTGPDFDKGFNFEFRDVVDSISYFGADYTEKLFEYSKIMNEVPVTVKFQQIAKLNFSDIEEINFRDISSTMPDLKEAFIDRKYN